MPSDSGHSIEDSTYETEERLPALDGDTPDPLQGLMPIGTLVESADTTISPITPLPDPITPLPEVEDEEEIGDTPNPAHGLPSLRTLPELFLLQEERRSWKYPRPCSRIATNGKATARVTVTIYG